MSVDRLWIMTAATANSMILSGDTAAVVLSLWDWAAAVWQQLQWRISSSGAMLSKDLLGVPQ